MARCLPARLSPALRRAICSAYNVDDEIRIIRQGQATVATQPIPPDIAGHLKDYKGFARYDPGVARALLDRFGYRDRDGDGYRETSDGHPLVIRIALLPLWIPITPLQKLTSTSCV